MVDNELDCEEHTYNINDEQENEHPSFAVPYSVHSDEQNDCR